MSFFNKITLLFKPEQPVAGVAEIAVAEIKNEERAVELPDQPERNEKTENGLNHASAKTNAIPASPEHVTQDQVTEIIQAAVNLAEQFKADRRGADLEEIEKAFNTVMYAERVGKESDFAYALMELEALTEEYSQAAEKAVA